jgi:hypothetical protein
LVTAHGPAPIQCLTSQAGSNYATAAPPCISGRTSYLQVRLAFHLYPQVIPLFCNTGGFGPRRGLTPASPCPWVAHLVSGRILATHSIDAPASDSLSLRLHGFCLYYRLTCPLHPRGAEDAANIHSPDHSTKGTPLGRWVSAVQIHASYSSDCLSVQGFRGSFIPLPWCFSPFPHGTGSLSVARSIRALEGGPPSFPQGFSCPVVLRYSAQQPCARFRYGTLTRSGGPSQTLRVTLTPLLWTHLRKSCHCPLNPDNAGSYTNSAGLGASPVRSPLLRASPRTRLPPYARQSLLRTTAVDSASSGY